MNREAFLFLGVCMLLIAVLQGEDVFDRAARGAMDCGRLLATRWTTAAGRGPSDLGRSGLRQRDDIAAQHSSDATMLKGLTVSPDDQDDALKFRRLRRLISGSSSSHAGA